VSLVAILDADKEGYLRSESALIQNIGRAARHIDGHVIMYADTMTGSMERAIRETYRRREKQLHHNEAHDITPVGIRKAIKDISNRVKAVAEATEAYRVGSAESMPKDEIVRVIKDLELEMKQAARDLEFEKAALLRDQIVDLRRVMQSEDPVVPREWLKTR
jgi:excinuclease ABC subunit B